MMFLIRLLMPVLGGMVLPIAALGQVVVLAPTLTARTGDVINVPIRLVSNDSINGLQFTLKWNISVLKYVDLTSLGLTGQSLDGNFGRTDTANGTIRFLWAHPQARNITVTDTLTLFQLRLRVMGSGGTSSLIAIADTPTRAIATTGANANSIPIQKRNGVVQVLTTGVNEVAESPKSLFLYPNEPNPAMDFFHIKFYLNQSEYLIGYLMDMTGQTVHTFRQQFASGTHRIPIPIQHLSTGMYRLVLNANGQIQQRALLITH
jgi:Cohesin domain/Secretion system C-terminal sorting domain